MHSLEISILKTVSYFDVFAYPLIIDEIVFFADKYTNEKEVTIALKHLFDTKQLFQLNDFYSIRNEPGIFERRVRGNKLAAKHIKKAIAVAKFLYWFPFIRGIAISGSLSKNFADEKSDLDFFIITKANRLWIVRILYSALFKIACFTKTKNWFCLNYFIDEIHLEIKEHNLFTAVEVSTLIPLKGKLIFEDFFNANSWVYQYQPNYNPNFKYIKDASPIIPKRIAECTLNFEYGNKLDNKLLSFFKKRFEKITAENILSEKGLVIGAYEANKHFCKPLPQYFQPKILAKFQERFTMIKDKYYNEIKNREMILQSKCIANESK